jgi:hypothetical protein
VFGFRGANTVAVLVVNGVPYARRAARFAVVSGSRPAGLEHYFAFAGSLGRLANLSVSWRRGSATGAAAGLIFAGGTGGPVMTSKSFDTALLLF